MTEAEALTRKAGTESRLAAAGIAVPDHLPRIWSVDEAKARTASEVALRAYSLLVTAVRADSLLSEDEFPVAELRDRFPQGFQALTPRETAFLAADDPDQQALLDATWRYEALALLQWTLNWAEEPAWPTDICDVRAVVRVMRDADADQRIADAALRPTAELLDSLDLHYRMHWALRQAKLDGRPAPGGLDEGVVMERHHALNWLFRFLDADWDDVDTPT